MDTSLSKIYDYITTKHGNKITKATEPLKDILNISYFSYQKVDSVGNYTVLCDNHDFGQFYLQNEFYLDDPFLVSPGQYKDGKSIHIISSKFYELDESISKIYNSTSKKFKFSDSIVYITKNHDYYEIFVFSIPDNKEFILHSCLNQMDLLEKFITHFKKSQRNLLDEICEAQVNIAAIRGQTFNHEHPNYHLINQDLRDTFLETISPEEHMLRLRIKDLTKRERECLYWVVAGKTASETADILGISRRTVETYRDNSRDKLGPHYTFSNLCYLIGKYSLL